MSDTMKLIGGVVIGILVIDAIGFMAWVISGQHPMDNFYIGTITAHFLGLFF